MDSIPIENPKSKIENPPIPQTDPRANYWAHKDAIDAAIAGVLDGGWYILGEEVRAFEREFAAWLGAGDAVGVANGTDALSIALRAAGVEPGDGVITVSHTAVATVAAVEMARAVPVLVDVEPGRCTLDPNAIEGAIEVARRNGTVVKAIVPVHLYGHPADMPAIMEIARRNGLLVVEDCAQAHGAAIGGHTTGTWGDIAAFSFYPTKNLGALGDGGAIVTSNAAMAGRARLIREYGWRDRYVSDIPGVNSRLDELQAAALRVKLHHLEGENEKRRAIAAIYDAGLAGCGIGLPSIAGDVRHAFHQYVVRTPRRDELRAVLRGHGIGSLVHYPIPVHLQPAYSGRVAVCGNMAVTERLAAEVLSLPMFPELRAGQAAEVVARIVEWVGAVASGTDAG